MKSVLLESIGLVERVHRLFVEVVADWLSRRNVRDINAVQALIAYNIGTQDLTVGELTERGCYQGSNVSYNLKTLAAQGYTQQGRDPNDRRAVRVSLTPKGLALFEEIDAYLTRMAATFSTPEQAEDLRHASISLQSLSRQLVENRRIN